MTSVRLNTSNFDNRYIDTIWFPLRLFNPLFFYSSLPLVLS